MVTPMAQQTELSLIPVDLIQRQETMVAVMIVVAGPALLGPPLGRLLNRMDK
jgi:hypothetical protein